MIILTVASYIIIASIASVVVVGFPVLYQETNIGRVFSGSKTVDTTRTTTVDTTQTTTRTTTVDTTQTTTVDSYKERLFKRSKTPFVYFNFSFPLIKTSYDKKLESLLEDHFYSVRLNNLLHQKNLGVRFNLAYYPFDYGEKAALGISFQHFIMEDAIQNNPYPKPRKSRSSGCDWDFDFVALGGLPLPDFSCKANVPNNYRNFEAQWLKMDSSMLSISSMYFFIKRALVRL